MLTGTGYSVDHTSTGVYYISFTKPFSATPDCVVICNGGVFFYYACNLVSVSADEIAVQTLMLNVDLSWPIPDSASPPIRWRASWRRTRTRWSPLLSPFSVQSGRTDYANRCKGSKRRFFLTNSFTAAHTIQACGSRKASPALDHKAAPHVQEISLLSFLLLKALLYQSDR